MILLAEDEELLSEALQSILKDEGFEVNAFYDGQMAEEAALEKEYDLYILDVMLPRKDGFQIAKSIRQYGIDAPILFMTAKSSIDDKEIGFQVGADDYLTKPFETKELLMRIRALLRRYGIEERPEFGNVRLDLSKSILWNKENEENVRLLSKELNLMEYLFQNKNRILSKDQISNHIWGMESEAEYNNTEVYISFIRKKLRFIHANIEIKTFRGMGYQLQVMK